MNVNDRGVIKFGNNVTGSHKTAILLICKIIFNDSSGATTDTAYKKILTPLKIQNMDETIKGNDNKAIIENLW